MQTCVANGFVLYTGGAQGTDRLAEDLGQHFGIQVEVLVPPGNSRTRTISAVPPQVLVLANPHIESAAEKLNKRVPTQFYILQLIQRNYEIFRRAHTVYAFGILKNNDKTSPRGNRVVHATGFGSRQKSLSVRHCFSSLVPL